MFLLILESLYLIDYSVTIIFKLHNKYLIVLVDRRFNSYVHAKANIF